tara:strand:+ start:9399 stop:10289 length:891 start_codon:yes stop_codon:yes gene_type:complete
MFEGKITIVSVNWFSSDHLKRLAVNLLDKAKSKNQIEFLIIDNTNGSDLKLSTVFKDIPNSKIIVHNSRSMQRSIAHASAIEFAIPLVETQYTLIIDPDVHIFKKGWDSSCIAEIKSGKSSIGAPYPKWKLGKIHDAPSVVFFFGETCWFKTVNCSWYPFPSNIKRVYNFIIRKFVRFFGFSKRKNLEKFSLLFEISKLLEKLTGLTSPDTGWEFSLASINNGSEAQVFEAPFNTQLSEKNSYLSRLAMNFELFLWFEDPFMTHMYSSDIFYYKTSESGNLNEWLSAISEIEEKLS